MTLGCTIDEIPPFRHIDLISIFSQYRNILIQDSDELKEKPATMAATSYQ